MRNTRAYRVDARKFRKMCRAGLFGDDKVELLNGILTMMTTGPAHDNAVTALGDEFEARLPKDRWTVREEKTVQMGLFWRPNPDVAVVRGPRPNFATRTPHSGDVALLVEVSDTTYATDTGRKLRHYERCGIPIYWVVDLNRRRVEVREMTARGLDPVVLYHDHEGIPLVLDGHDYGRVPVRELLP